MARRNVNGRSASPYKSDVPGLRPCIERQSANTSEISVRRLRLRKSRRCGRRDQCFSARTSRLSLWRDGAVRPLDEAGSHRSDAQIIAQRRRNPRPLGRGGCQVRDAVGGAADFGGVPGGRFGGRAVLVAAGGERQQHGGAAGAQQRDEGTESWRSGWVDGTAVLRCCCF